MAVRLGHGLKKTMIPNKTGNVLFKMVNKPSIAKKLFMNAFNCGQI